METPTVIVRRKRHPRAIALGALGAGAFAIGLLAGAGHDSGTGTSRNAGAAHQAPAAVRKHAAAARSTTPSRRAAATGSTGSSSARSTSSQAPGRATSTPSSSSGVSASALQARGHALLSSGDYGAAVPLLRQAVAAASPGSLTSAYALYDLGHALRLAGNPRAAVPILRQRLAIPNQTDIVRAELARALAALSAGSAPSAQGGAAAAPLRLHAPGGHDGKEAPGQLKKHGHEGGADGGD